MTTARADIHAGPSKFDLMLALFDRNASNPRVVQFTVGPDHRGFDVVINGVEVEDGLGENWIFKGYVRDGSRTGVSRTPDSTVFGFYRTNNRSGWIDFNY